MDEKYRSYFLVIVLIVAIIAFGIAIYSGFSVPAPQGQYIATCNDPNKNIDTFGICTSASGNLTDTCLNSTTLNEAYCRSNNCTYMTYKCSNYGYNSCSLGRCV